MADFTHAEPGTTLRSEKARQQAQTASDFYASTSLGFVSHFKMEYPRSKIPISPVFSGRGLTRLPDDSVSSILASRYCLHVSSGRAAIALALEHSGIAAGDEVLVPAYHCESMVSPVTWRNAKPVFYKINMDLTVDADDIRRKLSVKTRAIIATHYFGFIQDMRPLADLCEEHGLVLIEDCAHAFFGTKYNKAVGSWGDYAIASTMKFFPVYDGGVLSSRSRRVDLIELQPLSTSFQLKSALNVIQNAIAYGRLGWIGRVLKYLTSFTDSVWKGFKQVAPKHSAGIASPCSSAGGYDLDVLWIHKHASWFTKFITEHSLSTRIIDARRKNFRTLSDGLGDLHTARPFFTDLPSGTVPLVFPLYVDNPGQHFGRLKKAGVPIWRFGEFLDSSVTMGLCPNSIALSEHVFQFPCHEELSRQEIAWMIEQIRQSFLLEQPR